MKMTRTAGNGRRNGNGAAATLSRLAIAGLLGTVTLAAAEPASAQRPVPPAPEAPRARAIEAPPGQMIYRYSLAAQDRGWLGIGVELVPPLAPGQAAPPANGRRDATSILISNVAPGSPADSAGLQAGDRLTHIDERPATAETFGELAANLQVGDRVALTVLRNDRSRVYTLTAAARPSVYFLRPSAEVMEFRIDSIRDQVFRGMDSIRVSFREVEGQRPLLRAQLDSLRAQDSRIIALRGSLGSDTIRRAMIIRADSAMRRAETANAMMQEALALRGTATFSPALTGRHAVAGAQMIELNPGLADYLNVGEDGVFVTEVVEGSPAWDAGLRAGDVIVRMNERRVGSLTDVRAELNVSQRTSSPTRVSVARRGERLDFTIPR